jgi:hypothetical protein
MLARLWWKEWRSSWAIWLIVALTAVGLECYFLAVAPTDARSGILSPVALGWATIYTFAIGAAAFAGERETRTLALLDALPVGRTTLWLGKASFTLASSVVLALVLVAAAEAGTGPGQPHRDWTHYGPRVLMFAYGTLVLEAVGWSLLWSALLNHALVAAILSILSVAAVRTVLTSVWLMDEWVDRAPEQLTGHALGRLALAAGAAAASYALVTLRPGVRLARPGTRSTRVSVPRRSEERDEAVREGVTRARASALRSLAWQTYRDGRTVWALWMLLGLVVPALLASLGDYWIDPVGRAVITGVVLAMAAGVSLFGHDSQQRTSRFFAGHGVDSRLVWLVRVSVGLLVLAVYGVGLRLLLALDPSARAWSRATIGGMFVIEAFAVGQLLGMLVRRQITAVVTGMLALALLVGPHMLLAAAEMVPWWSLLLPPLALLAIGLGWAGPWANQESAASGWRRLALLAAVPAALLLGSYVVYRAWSVPDVGYPFDRSVLRTDSRPGDTTALELYRDAEEDTLEMVPFGMTPDYNTERYQWEEIDEVIEQGWDPGRRRVVAWWSRLTEPLLAKIRLAARQPHIDFGSTAWTNPLTPNDWVVGNLPVLARALAVDARERESRGDLAGSWEDQGAMFRMSTQLTEPPATLARVQSAFQIRNLAFGPAFSWACLPGQSPELLRTALEDVRHSEGPAPRETIELEHELAERTLDLPGDALRGVLLRASVEHDVGQILRLILITAPWERERTRRVLRAITAWHLATSSPTSSSQREALLVRWMESERRGARFRPRPPDSTSPALGHYRQSTPLARLLEPPTQAMMAQYQFDLAWTRALELFLALRIWQLEHGGKYPATLHELVPSVLPSLPADPYSSQPFGYVKSNGQRLLPLNKAGHLDVAVGSIPATRPGQRLVYSVGPDGRDDRAAASASSVGALEGDLVIPLPDPEPEHVR